jgi:hypothetical protein
MTRYRHTGMHENILLVVTERPGIGYADLREACIGDLRGGHAERELKESIRELIHAERLEGLPGSRATYRLRPPEPFSARFRRFLLSFPGIPRYGARRSQNASHERNR